MSIPHRFVVWNLSVVAQLLVFPVWSAAAKYQHSSKLFFAGEVTSLALTAAVVVLILTTPGDAIRLSPTRSTVFIAAGTAWLFGWQVALLQQSTASVIGAVVGVIGVTAMARAAIYHRMSPWLAACFAWTVLFVGPIAMPMRFSGFLFPVLAALWFVLASKLKRTKLTP